MSEPREVPILRDEFPEWYEAVMDNIIAPETALQLARHGVTTPKKAKCKNIEIIRREIDKHMLKAELADIAKERGVKVPAPGRKDQIIRALKRHDAAQEAWWAELRGRRVTNIMSDENNGPVWDLHDFCKYGPQKEPVEKDIDSPGKK